MSGRYCICRSKDGKGFMVACDHCEEWYHGKCIGINKRQANGIELYYCDQCKKANPSLETQYKPGQAPLQKKQEQPLAPKIIEPSPPKKRKVSQKTKPKSHARKQCANPDCIYESRQESKYCSDECGYAFNKLRYDTHFIPKWQVLEQNHSVARQRKLGDLAQLEKDKEDVEKLIKNLRFEKEELEHSIKVIKEQAKRLSRENANSKENDDEDADLDNDDVEEITTGDASKTFCITCGVTIPSHQALKHWYTCHKKHESTYNFTADVQIKYSSEGDENPKLYCHFLDKKTQRFCMHIESACPQHSNWLIDKDEVCGCPLNLSQKLEPDGNYCLQLKKDCTLHYHWDKFRLAQINMQRINSFSRLETIKDKIRFAESNLMDSYGGVVGVMLHNTIDHLKKLDNSNGQDGQHVEDVDMAPLNVE